MAKRLLFIAVALAAFVVSAWSEAPKIAVLDVTIPKGFDSSVVIPVTESIMEQLVASRKYTVLDRANIEAIFKERDFQLSGEVSNDQVTQAGKFLGASYVVVSKIQLVGGSYFLSAKMIDTETAAITTQASDSQKGDASVVIAMAQAVGAKIAGITVASVSPSPSPSVKPSPSLKPSPSPRPEPSQEPAPSPQPSPADQKAPVFRIVADLSLPTWSDNLGKAAESTGRNLVSKSLADNPQSLDIGLEAYAHLNLGGWFYLVAEYDYFASQLKDTSFTSTSKYYDNFTLSNIMGGLGLSIPIDVFAQIYGGGLVGSGRMTIGNLWDQFTYSGSLTNPSSLSKKYEDGLAYAVEVGGCLYIVHYITIDVRFRYGGVIFGLGSSSSSSTSASKWYRDIADFLGSSTSSSSFDSLSYSTLAFGIGLSL